MVRKLRKHTTFKTKKKTYKKKSGVSKQELEVMSMIMTEFPKLKVYRGNREILHGKELDILIPSKNLAIEFDGLYYHNTAYTGNFLNWHSPKTSTYHLYKTIECEKKQIQLIHIFSDEWERKKPLVIDLIKKTLGKSQVILATECIIQEVPIEEARHFINCSCLLGDDPDAQSYLGIYYKDMLMAVVSYTEFEDYVRIYRYTERLTITIDKGLSLFLNKFNKKIITEVDRRLSVGKEYRDEGFALVKATEPKLFYTLDFKSRLPSWRSGMTEEQAYQKGFVGVYDCGDLVFEREITKEKEEV